MKKKQTGEKERKCVGNKGRKETRKKEQGQNKHAVRSAEEEEEVDGIN